jgi:polyferredoxin
MKSYKIKMNGTESLLLVLVTFCFVIFVTYFGSEFIVKYVDLPFIVVFLIGIFFPPLWFLILVYALFKRYEDGPIQRPYYPPQVQQPYAQ